MLPLSWGESRVIHPELSAVGGSHWFARLAPTVGHTKVVPMGELQPPMLLKGCGCFLTFSAHPSPRVPSVSPPFPPPAMVQQWGGNGNAQGEFGNKS